MAWGGKYFLIVEDRATGFVMVKNLGTRSSAKEVVEKVRLIFEIFGYLRVVCYDIGLHFRGPFENLLKECQIQLNPSSSYNPSSN